MSNHKGSEGTVHIGTDDLGGELKSWSYSESSNTIDDSTLVDDWSTKKGGQKSWTGSTEAFWDEADTAQIAVTIGAEVLLKFYPEGATSGDTYKSGQAIVTSIESSAAIDGMVEYSFSFEGNGALTEATVV